MRAEPGRAGPSRASQVFILNRAQGASALERTAGRGPRGTRKRAAPRAVLHALGPAGQCRDGDACAGTLLMSNTCVRSETRIS